jgi:purine-binding chemotaxis protein CheW
MKTLEQYFNDQPLLPNDATSNAGKELTSAEQAFLNKYLGILSPAQQDAARQIPSVTPKQVINGDAFSLPQNVSGVSEAIPPAPKQDASQTQKILRDQDVLQLIGFRLAAQEYALPIDVIQEVIRTVEATKLPAAPAFLSGVINLRGKVTPLISLRTLLGLPPDEDKFVVVCRHADLQLGLQIQAVSTMHRVSQNRIDWGVAALLGIQNDFIAGLIRTEQQRLISILSLHHIVQTLLKK